MNFVTRLGDLPTPGDCIGVAKTLVLILERWLYFKLEGITNKLHSDDTLVDGHFCCWIAIFKNISNALKNSSRPILVAVRGAYVGR